MGLDDGKGAAGAGHSFEVESTGGERVGFSGPLSKRNSKKSARFNIPGETSSMAGDDAYVEITLDVRDDTVAVHSVKTAGQDEEDPEISLLAKNLEKKSSFGSNIVRSASNRIRQVSQELKRLASVTSTPAGAKLDRSKSATAGALISLKFISKADGGAGWPAVEKRFKELSIEGVLPRSLFGQCIGIYSPDALPSPPPSLSLALSDLSVILSRIILILSSFCDSGMKESKEFAIALYDALARRKNIVAPFITKDELRDFWEQISDQSFDARLQTFFDM